MTEYVQPFGRGPRVYIDGVSDSVTEEQVREHFGKWGSIPNVYFPCATGQKRPNYCFVTFDNRLSAEHACNESARSLNGWVRLAEGTVVCVLGVQRVHCCTISLQKLQARLCTQHTLGVTTLLSVVPVLYAAPSYTQGHMPTD